MTDIRDGSFSRGQAIWVMQEGGSQRAAKYIGEGEPSAWFGGASTVLVLYEDTGDGAAVDSDRIIARET